MTQSRVIHVHVHVTCDDDKIDSVLTKLQAVSQQLEDLKMSVAQDFESLRTQIDAATTAVAQKIDRLSGQIKNSMTDDEVNTLKSEFGAISDRLTALGSDPTNPVPPEPAPSATTKKGHK